MVPDPYKVLGLDDHNASKDEIKRSYRKLAMRLHPDRLMRMGASADEIYAATHQFAAVTSAYRILSDPERKRQYDHIYKYGGYDHVVETTTGTIKDNNENPSRYGPGPAPKRHNSGRPETRAPNITTRETNNKGIGYAMYDPFVYLASKGKVKSKTVAGVSIPSRLNMMRSPQVGVGLGVSFSSGQIQKTSSGSLLVTSKTTQFVGGKQYNRNETTTVHRDGRKEVLIEGDDYVERRVSVVPKRKRRPSNESSQRQQHQHRTSTGQHQPRRRRPSQTSSPHSDDDWTLTGPDDDLPWYMSAWNGMRDSIQMCTTGTCGSAIRVQ